MRYIDLMNSQKPHLLVRLVNNLGAETRVHYSPSTRFYVADKMAGKPWITRLPFPVHVVERVETYDHVSRNRFVTRYAYHHGYFDGDEREFRGFGMVEQFDTEVFAALTAGGELPVGDNIDPASHVPPVLTKTWFHTGVFVGRDHISNFFTGLTVSGDGEYYREPDLTDLQAQALLLDDTVLPDGLSAEEEREACRALKGAVLRQEVYALDNTPKEGLPYSVSERNYTLKQLQPRGQNRHAVFFSHLREAIEFYYERDDLHPPDPRISHSLTLEVNDFGNVLKSVAIGYGRRQPDLSLPAADRARQTQTLITYTENAFTDPVMLNEAYRAPLPCETRSYELTDYTPSPAPGRFGFPDFIRFEFPDFVQTVLNGMAHSFDSEINYEEGATNGRQRRLIEQVRTYYRPNDLGATQNDPLAQLPLGESGSLALPGEVYRLALTPGLLTQVYRRPRDGQPPDNLLPDAAVVLSADVPAGQFAGRGGYVDLDGDSRWWIPSGRAFYSPGIGDTPARELAYARQHFFLPHRYHDAFEQPSTVTYDRHRLLVQETRDALGNLVTVGERNLNPDLPLVSDGHDYRVLQPRLAMDPNRNCSELAFDALGMVVGTAIMGKPEENPRPGDSLIGFATDLTQQQIDVVLGAPDPRAAARPLLASATTRLIFDVNRFHRTQQTNPTDPTRWDPAYATMLARETHASDLRNDEQARLQISFSYSDGFAREIQKKMQAEAGPAPRRDRATGRIIAVDGRPEMTPNNPRWVGSGWTIYNNKGKPVRQYEPYFTDSHRFEFDVRIGVSPVLFYDPLDRIIATLYANGTYAKVVFDPWRQETWDVNDTVLLDPRTDSDIEPITRQYFTALASTSSSWQTWYAVRMTGGLGSREQTTTRKTVLHANTPATAYLDTLGRPFLTRAHNGFQQDGTAVQYTQRVHLDIEGNQREVIDARDRVVMRYDYDMLGNRVHQASMEAGHRWILNDVTGQPIGVWDSRGHDFRTEYDQLRRPVRRYVRGTSVNNSDPRTFNREVLFERVEYGEGQVDDFRNLRTRIYRQDDGAGTITTDAYDFKGNPLSGSRRLAQDYRALLNWSAAVPMEAETYRSSTAYDALNRPVAMVTPDSTTIRPTYNEASLLEAIEANLRGDAGVTSFVTGIGYDAKGQRTLIDYGNGARTIYEYDPLTFRLAHLVTRRDAILFPDDCPQPPPADWPGCQIQNLRYSYDPAGNITRIQDDAQQIVYFRNRRVEPSNDYTYDAVYRLIEATGREHLGQNGENAFLPADPTSYNDTPRVRLLHQADGNAMGTYVQRFMYDEVGNILEMIHRRSDPAQPNWRRAYIYNEASLIEAGFSNRLSRTVVHPDGAQPIPEPYSHDAHGNMTAMPHLQVMQWDFKDQLYMTRRQAVNPQDDEGSQRQGERTYYIYDSAGQRVRKVTVLASDQLHDDRIYLGPFEIYHRYGANPVIRETLHIADDTKRIALIETRTHGNDGSPAQFIRYQFANHLGSAILELDDQVQIISYEEYYPYGSTSFQARTEAPKGYRYTSKERDEESGLYYCQARYHAAWLGRWISPDPIGLNGSGNLYEYVDGDPVTYVDNTGTQPELTPLEAAAKAEEAGKAVLQSKYSNVGQVVDITPAKNVSAKGVDVHLVVGQGKAAVNVIGDIKHANVASSSGGSLVYSGKEVPGEISAFENAAKRNYGQLVHNIRQALARGSLDPATAYHAIQNAKAGLVLHEVVPSGYNTRVEQSILTRYQASTTQSDVFADAASHRESLELKRELGPTHAKSGNPTTVFNQFKNAVAQGQLLSSASRPTRSGSPRAPSNAGFVRPEVLQTTLGTAALAYTLTQNTPAGHTTVDLFDVHSTESFYAESEAIIETVLHNLGVDVTYENTMTGERSVWEGDAFWKDWSARAGEQLQQYATALWYFRNL